MISNMEEIRMDNTEKTCGTCKYHEHDEEYNDWVCTNSESEYMADFTDYNHSCSEHEERE